MLSFFWIANFCSQHCVNIERGGKGFFTGGWRFLLARIVGKIEAIGELGPLGADVHTSILLGWPGNKQAVLYVN